MGRVISQDSERGRDPIASYYRFAPLLSSRIMHLYMSNPARNSRCSPVCTGTSALMQHEEPGGACSSSWLELAMLTYWLADFIPLLPRKRQ